MVTDSAGHTATAQATTTAQLAISGPAFLSIGDNAFTGSGGVAPYFFDATLRTGNVTFTIDHSTGVLNVTGGAGGTVEIILTDSQGCGAVITRGLAD